MSKNKRVVLFGNTPESLINFRGPLLKSMVGAGNKVFAISPPCNSSQLKALNDMGVEYVPISFARTGLNPFADISTIISIYRALKKINPHSILTYALKPIFYGSLVAKILGIRHFPMLVGLGYTAGYTFSSNFKVLLKGKLLWPIISFLYKLSLNSSEKIFVYNKDILSLFIEKRLIKNKDKTVLVNGSGVDINHFNLCELPKELSFLLIARLLSDKGLYEYADAARSLKTRYPDIKFKLVGFIDEQNPTAIPRKILNEWIDEEIIEYLGRLEDVRNVISESSVYVLPSYHEGIPRSVLEAMSMGRAVVTTDTFGCRETVDDGINGFLVPIKDSKALEGAMEKFILSPELIKRMGSASRKIVVSRFSTSIINDTILSTMDIK